MRGAGRWRCGYQAIGRDGDFIASSTWFVAEYARLEWVDPAQVAPNGGTMSRLPSRSRDELTSEQRDEYDDLARTRTPRADGTIGGPFDAWLLSPELSHRLRGLAVMLWERTSLDRGLVELAISITGRYWEADVEWAAHAPRAIEYGIAPEVLDAILEGRRPEFAPERQLLLYDICMSLHRERALPKPLYESAVRAFGEQGLVEIIAVIGFYTLVSMTLNAFEIPVAPGVDAPFARADRPTA